MTLIPESCLTFLGPKLKNRKHRIKRQVPKTIGTAAHGVIRHRHLHPTALSYERHLTSTSESCTGILLKCEGYPHSFDEGIHPSSRLFRNTSLPIRRCVTLVPTFMVFGSYGL